MVHLRPPPIKAAFPDDLVRDLILDLFGPTLTIELNLKIVYGQNLSISSPILIITNF